MRWESPKGRVQNRELSIIDSVRRSWVISSPQSRGKPADGDSEVGQVRMSSKVTERVKILRSSTSTWAGADLGFCFRHTCPYQHGWVEKAVHLASCNHDMRIFNFKDSFDARKKYTHFRILVIGRANAGKTTLLKRVCNTTEEPCIYDEKNNNLVRLLPSLSVAPTSTTNSSIIIDRSDCRGNYSVRRSNSTLWSQIFISAESTISTVHSSLPATPNLSSMILQASRLEMNHRSTKSKTSSPNAPSPRK